MNLYNTIRLNIRKYFGGGLIEILKLMTVWSANAGTNILTCLSIFESSADVKTASFVETTHLSPFKHSLKVQPTLKAKFVPLICITQPDDKFSKKFYRVMIYFGLFEK